MKLLSGPDKIDWRYTRAVPTVDAVHIQQQTGGEPRDTIETLPKSMLSHSSLYRARSERSAVAAYLRWRTLRRCVGFGVPVVECRLLGRLSRVRRTSGCCWQRGRPAGAPGPRYARRLARARGSVYRRQHGTPCPPLLPPRRPLAKREQRRELSFTWLSCPCPLLEESRVSFSFFSFCPRFRERLLSALSSRSACVLELLLCGWKVVR